MCPVAIKLFVGDMHKDYVDFIDGIGDFNTVTWAVMQYWRARLYDIIVILGGELTILHSKYRELSGKEKCTKTSP